MTPNEEEEGFDEECPYCHKIFPRPAAWTDGHCLQCGASYEWQDVPEMQWHPPKSLCPHCGK